VTTCGSSEVGTDGKGSSTRAHGGGVVVDIDMGTSGGDAPPRRDVQTVAVEFLQKRG